MGVALTGLTSGLDTNAIIDQLVAMERAPATKLSQRQSVEQARISGYRDISNRLGVLRSAWTGLRDNTLWSSSQEIASANPAVLAVSGTAAAPGGYSIAVSQLARAEQWAADIGFAAAGAADTLQLQLGVATAVDVAIEAGDTLDQIAARVNAAGAGVLATVAGGRLYLSGRSTGATQALTISSSGGLAASMGLTRTQTAADALYTVNGGAEQSSSTNTLETAIPGLSLQLRGVATTAVTVTTPSSSEDKLRERLQAFVTAYNDLMSALSSKLNEKAVKKPLTDSDRARGSLAGDLTLQSLASALRANVGHLVDGQGFADLGVAVKAAGTASDPDSLVGKLSFDSQRLAAAWETDAAAVKQLLHNPSGDTASQGLTQHLDSVLGAFWGSGGSLQTAIDTRTSRVSSLGSQIDRVNQRVGAYEARLQKQFGQMESALALLRSQQASLSAQMARLG